MDVAITRPVGHHIKIEGDISSEEIGLLLALIGTQPGTFLGNTFEPIMRYVEREGLYKYYEAGLEKVERA